MACRTMCVNVIVLKCRSFGYQMLLFERLTRCHYASSESAAFISLRELIGIGISSASALRNRVIDGVAGRLALVARSLEAIQTTSGRSHEVFRMKTASCPAAIGEPQS